MLILGLNLGKALGLSFRHFGAETRQPILVLYFCLFGGFILALFGGFILTLLEASFLPFPLGGSFWPFVGPF